MNAVRMLNGERIMKSIFLKRWPVFWHESQVQNLSQMPGYTLGDGWFWNWLAHNWGSEFKRWHSYPENDPSVMSCEFVWWYFLKKKMPFKGSVFQHHLVSLLKHHKFYSDASTCAQRMSNLLKLGSGRHLRLFHSKWDVSLGSWPLVE